ncbi:hypothetical protein HF086_013044 [Spodoptera exigua]|uniref:Uncharacterized protein n=1 Tax=Spodoptera exigua TaxID=7107 RepID=A0A922MEN4_SPOEX|nr:hypothetical protein HF086_013044 [Spodoptera exigua]
MKMSNSLSSNKSHSKKANSSRERDRNKSVASESGGSSQCDTPPLNEKDGNSSQGKFAGISPDSVVCMAEQAGHEVSTEAITNLAEDVSYKLRQTISDTLLNVTEFALTPQSYVYSSEATVSVEWITDDKSLNNSSNISVSLQNYYTKVARGKPKEVAVEDLTTNTRIGPIFPNLFNLAVLVLNDDNLNALNVPAKKPLQSNVLDMVDALCSNPCSLDTNIQQQDVSTCLLRSEPTTYLEDYVTTDYTLYEMLGDSILPRRMIFPITDKITNEDTSQEKQSDEEFTYTPVRPVMKRPKLRLIPTTHSLRNGVHRESVFEPTKFKSDKCIRIKIKSCRTQVLRPTVRTSVSMPNYVCPPTGGVVVASGVLNRFRYKLNKSSEPFPIFGAVVL